MNKKYALIKLKNQLKTICKDTSFDNAKDYNDIRNACQDFEFTFGDDLSLCNFIDEQEVVTEDEVLQNFIPEKTDLASLRCFINTTYDDTIYRIDGYGNLDNVTTDFLSNMCDDLTTMIDKELKSLDADEEL